MGILRAPTNDVPPQVRDLRLNMQRRIRFAAQRHNRVPVFG